MRPRFLLDTNIVLRWLSEPRKLSRDQRRTIEDAEHRGEPLGVSAITLLEIVTVVESGRVRARIEDIFEQLSGGAFHIFPLTVEIASEMAAIGVALRDPADRVIVATARVHRLRLLTADQRIARSRLASVVE